LLLLLLGAALLPLFLLRAAADTVSQLVSSISSKQPS
jgi:hypothetical protein